MAGLGISVPGFLLRLLAAALLVFATYNPAGWSFLHWVRKSGGGPLPLKVLAGIALVAGWVFCVRATLRSLGHVGTALAAGFFGVLIWLFVDLRGTDVEGSTLAWIVLACLAATLAVGLSFSLVRRRVTGQIDDTDEE
ncbi:MAG TPA: DUF6524 family protein [Thermoanaerobaculia bacterium]|nr:DUF6524 family protein [Thermoanaerobaculia bacterium]HQP87563.1 DUF6524 family protein [Thermoanaerobaculia bacterium]